MDINRGNLDDLFTGFQTAMQAGLAMATKPVDPLAMVVNSRTAIEKYPIMFLLSTMRQWIGDRVVQDIEGNVLALENGDYEHTIGVLRNDIEDDQLGMYTPLFTKMGQDAENLWGKLAMDAMVANGNWIDGAAFFGTTRKFGANTIANYVTSALSSTTYGTARTAMMSYMGHNDQPLGIMPNLLVVGPKMEATAKKIVDSEKLVESYAADTDDATLLNHVAGPNPYYKTATVLVHPDLVGTRDDYWFLLATTGVVKPVIVQKRKVGALVRWDTDEAECVKTKNRNEYGLHYRGAAALTLPPYAYAGIL